MDEINPYATPSSSLDAEAAHARKKPLGYALYKWSTSIYGALAGLVYVAFFIQKGPEFSVALAAGVMVFAPLISYLLVVARWRWGFYAWMPMHLLCLCVIIASSGDWTAPEGSPKLEVAMFLSVVNMLSWLSSLYFHWRLSKK